MGNVVWPTTGHNTSTYAGHDGVDINADGQDYGNPVYAFRDGIIKYVGYGHGYGQAIFEYVPEVGKTVVYGHLSQVHVKAGDKVTAGQTIGNVGQTGNATGPHLHFGIPNGTYSQAMDLLKGATSVSGTSGNLFNTSGGPTLSHNPLVPDQLEQATYAIKWITYLPNLARVGLGFLGAIFILYSLFSWAGLEALNKVTGSLATKPLKLAKDAL